MSEEHIKPGYKRTEVGVIPEEWEVVSLGDISEIEGGYAFNSKSFLTRGQFQVIKMSNLYGGNLDLERSASFLNELTEQEQHYILHPYEIILTLTGTTGKYDYGYSYMVINEKNLLLNQRVGRIIVRNDSCAGYVFAQLRSPCFLKQFFNVSKGGTGNQTNVGTQDVAEMFIPLPPIHEQRAIATALSDVDALLAQLDQLIAKKRDLKQATMQQLLTGQTRLPGFSGAWQVKRLGDVLTYLGNGAVYEPTISFGLPVTRIETIADGTVDFSRVGYAVPTDELKKYKLKKGDILFSHINSIDHIGKVAIYESDIALYHGMNLLLLRPAEAITSRYLFYWLGSSHGRKHSVTLAKQAVSQASINTVELKGIEVPLPTVSEQTAIATILSTMDAELATLEARRDKTHALKQGMMQELLTGRIRLV